MYRQILVHPDDAAYQKILFRNNPDQVVRELRLDTVTYGTSYAPFLEVRTLRQLADDEKTNYPVASSILKRDFYVDDVLTGANTHEEASFLLNDLTQLLKSGGFTLRKWVSNVPSLTLENMKNVINKDMTFDSSPTIKTLGIQWNSREDVIVYKVNSLSCSKTVSKRSVFSQVAKLFDPLGLLGPVIVRAKIIIQLLWKAGVSWDESIPACIHTTWLEFKEQLPLLEKITFPRCILIDNAVKIEMHGFCDASEKAYGACIYLRSTDSNGNKTHFISVF